MRTFLCLLYFWGSGTSLLLAQQNYFDNYKAIECTGKVPYLFIEPLNKKIHADSLKIESLQNKDIRESTFNLYLETDLMQNELFSGSRVLFGDPISIYVNKVAKNIIKYNPELDIGIEVYAFNSNVVNAGAFCNKVVFVNIGLMAYLNNEAELAFVLCHEISHVLKEHAVKSIVDRYELEETYKKGRKQRSDKNAQLYVDEVFKKSMSQELQADSLGLKLFANTNYDINAVSSLLKLLNRVDFSYGDCKLSPSALTVENNSIPNEYFKESITPFSPIDQVRGSDRYSTHPNIKQRIGNVSGLSKNIKSKGNFLFEVESEKEFEFVRDISRFERVRQLILAKSYGDAIHESLCLLEKYPNNEYLNISIAKGFYGLAKYKNADEFSMAARSYSDVEGESQQIHYLLKQLDRKQLNVYAYKQVRSCSEKYPKNELLRRLENDLIKDLVVENKLQKDDLTYIGETDARKCYKVFLKKDLQDTSFVNCLSRNYVLLEERKKEDLIPKEKLDKQKEEEDAERKEKGPKLFVKKMIICSPSVIYINNDYKLDLEETTDNYQMVLNTITENARLNSIDISIMNNPFITEKGTSNYNKRGRILEWLEERMSHGNIEVIPLSTDILETNNANNNAKYICYVKLYMNEKNKYSYFTIALFDVETAKEELSFRSVNYNGILKEKQIVKEIADFFQTAKR